MGEVFWKHPVEGLQGGAVFVWEGTLANSR